jgi:hypothetical protein
MDLLGLLLLMAQLPWWLGWSLIVAGLCALSWLAGAGIR